LVIRIPNLEIFLFCQHNSTGSGNLELRQTILSTTIHLLNSRTVKVFASCRTVVQRLVIFTVTLVQKLEISNLKLSLINSVSFIQNITYTKWLHKKKI
jgi:hypothetical protein